MLGAFENHAKRLIETACDQSLDSLGFGKDEVEESNSPKAGRDRLKKAHIQPTKRLAYTEQSARRNACRRLERFVKLTDYYVVTALRQMVLNSMRQLLGQYFNLCSEPSSSVWKDLASTAEVFLFVNVGFRQRRYFTI